MWECEFKRFKDDHPRIYGMINGSRPRFAQRNRGKVTESEILKSVRDGDLFGMVEVDIEVPAQWGPEFKDRISLPPREYFSEMCPLFANMDVPFDIIGEHMQAHARAHGLSHAHDDYSLAV